MNDFWLFLGVMLFLFVLWVYTGGPNNPISFAGPYITPVSAPGVAQVGYGPSANQYLKSANIQPHAVATVVNSAHSPYVSDLNISYSDFRSSDPRTEYVHVHLNSDREVDITGWQLVGAKSGTHVTIPTGKRGGSSSDRDIRLSPDYRDAYIVTGSRGTDPLKSMYGDAWHTSLGIRSDIWPDDTDTITLLDQNGKVVDQYSY